MDFFDYSNGELHCEDVPIREIASREGTPLYVYSRRTILHHFSRLREAFSEPAFLICYSIKANSNLSILKALDEAGSGFDIVSLGELERARRIGADPQKIIFSGVGKTEEEIREALEAGILMINVESEEELVAVDRVARSVGREAGVALRLNPDVDPDTHEYITTGKEENKFGIPLPEARKVAARIPEMAGVKLLGLHIHIGSQITSVDPYVQAVRKAVEFARGLQDDGKDVRYLNIGGGFGIDYRPGEALTASEIARALQPLLQGDRWRMVIEPGRFIVGNAGVLVVSALYRKQTGRRRFLVTDGGMNDLIRPSLYGSYHHIWPVVAPLGPKTVSGRYPPGSSGLEGAPLPSGEGKTGEGGLHRVDVVGPICESGDFLGKDRILPPVEPGDLLAVFSAGAYSFAMSSNYNSRPRPAEVMVDGKEWRVVRRRETFDDLVRGEEP